MLRAVVPRRRLLVLWRLLPGWAKDAIEWVLLPKFLVGAMAVILDDEERVLLFRHTYRVDYPWGLPGGWLKGGESPVDAVEREIYEESGYRIKGRHPLVIGGDRALHRIDLIFLCDLVGGDFRPSAEVSEARFFALSELPDRVEPFHVQVVAYALDVRAGRVPGQPLHPDQIKSQTATGPRPSD